jgi:hypothetical protein
MYPVDPPTKIHAMPLSSVPMRSRRCDSAGPDTVITNPMSTNPIR